MPNIVLPATEKSWINDYRAANLLAKEGLTPLWAKAPFTGRSASGAEVSFDTGSIVLQGDGPGVDVLRERLAIEPVIVESLAGFDGLPLRHARIAVYGGGGAPYNHAAAYGALGFAVEFVFPEDILAGALAGYDMLAVPGGGNRAMFGQLDPLGEAGCRAVADFVRAGGMYLGCCAGAFDASLVSEGFLNVCPQQRQLQMINAEVWNSGNQMWGLQSPGVGVVRARTNGSHPVTFGMPPEMAISHYNGPLYELKPGTVAGATDATGLLRIVGTDADFTAAEHFLGEASDDLLVNRAIEFGAFNAVAGQYGKGRVVLFGSHPEFGLSLDLDDWSGPARMLANAAFWQAAEAGAPGIRKGAATAASVSSGEGLTAAVGKLDAVVEAAEALLKKDTSGAEWLKDELAMSTFGASGEEIWRRNLEGFRPVSRRIEARIGELEAALEKAGKLARAGVPESIDIASAIVGVDKAINLHVPAEWNIDFGYEGLLQQLDRANAMLARASDNFDKSFAPDPNPYAYMTDSPFQLAVGSYLSAAGVLADCDLLLQLQLDNLENAVIGNAITEAAHPAAPNRREAAGV